MGNENKIEMPTSETKSACLPSYTDLGDDWKCKVCGSELEHNDTFGNIDYCLNAIGHPRNYYDRERHPIKKGDIYKCTNEECGEYFYTVDGEDGLQEGYPC